jgi:hypothetical protein
VLSKRYSINPKTVAKWKRRTSVTDHPTGPKDAKSTVLTIEEEAIVVAFRRHTLLPLDDCLYALQATIPGLVTVLRRSLMSLCHLCFERQRADAAQIRVAATGVVEPVDVLEDCCLCLPSC